MIHRYYKDGQKIDVDYNSKKTIKQKVSIIVISILLFISCTARLDKSFKSDFSIMVLSDIHISNDKSKDERLVNLVNAINQSKFEKLDFVVATGDNVSSFYNNRNKGDSLDNNRVAKLYDIMNDIEIPFYLALGNHDYKIDRDKDSDAPFTFQEIDTMEVLWNKFGHIEPYYSVKHKGWNFILLNSMRGRYLKRFFDNDQINFLRDQLAERKPSLIFFHHPIKSDNVPDLKKPKDLITAKSEPELFKILNENKTIIKGIFEGHVHQWFVDKLFGTIPVYMTDSFGDNEKSPYQLIKIDTTLKTINVTQHEFIQN